MTVFTQHLQTLSIIHSDCNTSLDDESADVVLFYDMLESLLTPQKQLEELYRILKPEGILCAKDMHSDDKILSTITGNDLFKLKTKVKKQFMFIKL